MKKKDPSESVCALWMQTIKNDYFVKDLWHNTVAYPDLVDAIKKQIIDNNPSFGLIENKASGLCLIPTLKKEMPNFLIKAFEPAGKDKIDRATAASPVVEQGRVHLLKGDWNRYFINQHTVFPYGNHDDVVDTTSQSIIYALKTENGDISVDCIDYDHYSGGVLRGYN
jgi:predicted phage terminase large subunit-like protein